ncbi:ROK family protein [Pseudophaeobacter sp.]|uniref:glucokinase n=1 Tax=Pseudophaeobacter sp. TaxID=1971739 RepID=UPI0032998918
MTYLIGDIGGTNTRLALADASGLQGASLRHFENARFASFYDVLTQYLTSFDAPRITSTCLAIAGPVHETPPRLTNLNWEFDEGPIKEMTGAQSLVLVNDLAALSHALPELSQSQSLTRLGGPQPVAASGQSLVVGIGTGFNVSLSKQLADGTTMAFEAEMGHAQLPQAALDLLRAHLGEQATGSRHVEHWLSGAGLERIYTELSHNHLPGRDIMSRFEGGTDSHATAAVTLFARVLGLLCREMICQYMPRAGLVFAGSVARSLLTSRGLDLFSDSFLSGPPTVTELSNIPCLLIADDAAALQGCLQILLDQKALQAQRGS